MTERGLRFTLRELRRDFSAPGTYVLLAAAIILLTLSGPFGTLATLVPLPRLGFWTITVVLTFAVGDAAGTWVNAIATARAWRQPWRSLSIGVGAGVPASLVTAAINLLVFGPGEVTPRSLALTVAYVVTISVVMATVFAVLARSRHHPTEPRIGSSDTPPALIERLPLAKRGTLLSLSVSDHYVEVTTTAGRALLLLRLRDAIQETWPVPGLRIHRSHWVALEAIRDIARVDGKYVVDTTAGDRLPVSRTHLPDLRAAGLLPRR